VSDPVNLATALVAAAADRPDTLAVAAPVGRRASGDHVRLTYDALNRRSDAVAHGLVEAGIVRGTRTALMVRPGLDLFSVAFALLKVGAVPVLVDPGIGRRHVRACLARAAPEALIGVPAAHLARMLFGWGKGSVRRLVTAGPWAPWGGPTLRGLTATGRARGAFPIADTGPDDLAAIVFTSGSTGPPKGVRYSHGNLAAQMRAVRELLGVQPGEVDLPTFPLFALFDPALGMSTVIPRMDPSHPARANPALLAHTIASFGVSTMFGSPALLDNLGRWGGGGGVRFPSLRRVVSAGAPVRPEIVERLRPLLGDGGRILTPYGATEALPVAVIDHEEILGETRAATERGGGVCVGRPVPSIEVAVISVSDEPVESWDEALRLPPGEIGEIVVKGPQVTRGYVDAPHHDRLAKIADGDGFRHRMGDLGYLDGEGRLWMVGRKSHRVETPGGTLYPVQCEGVFNCHPGVRRSALVGVGEPGRAEPVLCVELEAEARTADRAALTDELLALGGAHPHTGGIRTILYRRGFPVDIRHNAKIDRPLLARWAARKLGRRP